MLAISSVKKPLSVSTAFGPCTANKLMWSLMFSNCASKVLRLVIQFQSFAMLLAFTTST